MWRDLLVINFFGSESKLVNYTGNRIPVAIADFENNTQDQSLNGLSGLLITSLEQSNYLSVLTKSRMFDFLKQICSYYETPKSKIFSNKRSRTINWKFRL